MKTSEIFMSHQDINRSQMFFSGGTKSVAVRAAGTAVPPHGVRSRGHSTPGGSSTAGPMSSSCAGGLKLISAAECISASRRAAAATPYMVIRSKTADRQEEGLAAVPVTATACRESLGHT